MGVKYTNNRSALSSFEPTLSGRSMIYTIHGFTAGVFTYIYNMQIYNDIYILYDIIYI